MKLNLGCGKIIKEGYINCDIVKHKGVNKVFNLNKKLPFKNNSVDEIIAHHIIEHLDRPDFFISECHRVMKKGGILSIKTPYFYHTASITCWQHRNYFNYEKLKGLGIDIYIPHFSEVDVKLRWGTLFLFIPTTWVAILIFNLSLCIYENTLLKNIAPAFEIIAEAKK